MAAPIRRPFARRVVTELAWHSLFIQHLLIEPVASFSANLCAGNFTIVDFPGFRADPPNTAASRAR